ncbi:epimerase [Helicobacter sp. 16-1353]|uniref:NAD-dependent epimerase/dehydratase family protein n=1 Tax=Helicobacter sp. 16-1353 TaxID=2004996 RepID=UPI000DCC97FA|nr:NAD-dependent epimerase/dehydratase family protein [Helicobacter sp. 16-1353]RAX54196.1 epimerase [Helicobacter sp. 16-1353]
MLTNTIIKADLREIFESLTQEQREKFRDSTILITGCAGFLGFYFTIFFTHFAKELGIKKIIGLDNFMLRIPEWVESLQDSNNNLIEIHKFDIIKDSIDSINSAKNANIIIHMASIASPIFYRKYPIETIDANIWGLRNLLEFYKDRAIKGFLFFSSSEIYGDPHSDFIPTDEEYKGNVSCIGPRACYDEAKRFGETMCYLFALKYNLPLSIARPFNNYGIGMNIDDKRVPADFAKAILENRDIEIFSDGTPKRTFCYISDAISGYLKVLTFGKFDYFNIGIDAPEISVYELAKIYQNLGRELCGYTGEIKLATSSDKDYLTHNPNRRCPNISKARKLLDYNPKIDVHIGVRRFLSFLLSQKDSAKSSGKNGVIK